MSIKVTQLIPLELYPANLAEDSVLMLKQFEQEGINYEEFKEKALFLDTDVINSINIFFNSNFEKIKEYIRIFSISENIENATLDQLNLIFENKLTTYEIDLIHDGLQAVDGEFSNFSFKIFVSDDTGAGFILIYPKNCK